MESTENVMEEKIIKMLAAHNLSPEDLTEEEMAELKDEIEAKNKGMLILDGVLSGGSLMKIEMRKLEKQLEVVSKERIEEHGSSDSVRINGEIFKSEGYKEPSKKEK